MILVMVMVAGCSDSGGVDRGSGDDSYGGGGGDIVAVVVMNYLVVVTSQRLPWR